MVFVLDRHGHPLDPCHPARARHLPAAGRATVVRHTPFVIRLRDRAAADSTVQGVQVGIDPGSKHTGIAVFRIEGGSRTGLYSIQLDHRGERIRDKLIARARYRRRRRSRNLRYRAPRFLNRTTPKGWLAPSLHHRVDGTTSWVGRLSRWAPVTAVHVERVAFDTHALSAGRPLAGVEYQQGTLYGYEVREYLLAKWGRACAYCGISGVPLNIDHIHPRSRGGSDRISNLTVACVACNQAKNATPGVKAGTHTERVAVRSTGNLNVRTRHGLMQGIHYRHVRLLQRADGYGYLTRSEARRCAAFPSGPEGPGFHAGGSR